MTALHISWILTWRRLIDRRLRLYLRRLLHHQHHWLTLSLLLRSSSTSHLQHHSEKILSLHRKTDIIVSTQCLQVCIERRHHSLSPRHFKFVTHFVILNHHRTQYDHNNRAWIDEHVDGGEREHAQHHHHYRTEIVVATGQTSFAIAVTAMTTSGAATKPATVHGDTATATASLAATTATSIAATITPTVAIAAQIVPLFLDVLVPNYAIQNIAQSIPKICGQVLKFLLYATQIVI
mmetsp:Transcript_37706/g.61986  ORF Transcript_37706/g.61986 Transcript_37706/m.61986 type:complete len:236 (-) Transcript_37706:135-842(-)